MKSFAAAWLFSVLCAAVACESPTSGPRTDSHTNWLRTCSNDGECGPLSCICGLCTQPCQNDLACGADTPGAACLGADDAGAQAACSGIRPPTSMCLPRCDAEQGCAVGQACVAGACLPQSSPGVTVTVDTSVQMQALTGFGATVGYAEGELATMSDRAALDQTMFAELGLDVLRFRNRYAEVPDGTLAQAQQLVAAATASLGRRPLVLLSSWSPPPALKQNASVFCAGDPAHCTLSRAPTGGFDYAGFAAHWRATLEAYARVDFHPDFIGIQNNPDWAPPLGRAFEACKFLPTEGKALADGVSTAYPGYAEALRAVQASLVDLPERPQLLGPELSGLLGIDSYLNALGDVRVDAIAHHLYGTDAGKLDTTSLTSLNQLQTQMALPLFQTEMEADGFETALLIHHALVTEGASMYLQQSLVSARSGPSSNPGALIGLESGQFVRQSPYFAVQHFARFTEPGWRRVAAVTSSTDVLASAWVAPEGDATTLVLINASAREQVVQLAPGRSFELTRTVFDGAERFASLGSQPGSALISLPPRSMATARY